MHLHLKAVNASDYFERREAPCPKDLKMSRYGATFRLAHINMCLDMRTVVRAAGPSPEGGGAEVFYSVPDMQAMEALLRDDPYVIAGVWSSWSIRTLVEFIEPVTQQAVCLDGSRRVTAVESPVSDQNCALSALMRLRNEQSLAVGGITSDGTAIAWMTTPDKPMALRQVKDSGLSVGAEPSSRSMIWVL
jgi:hypothetical protein